jgi:sugar/nucleoside kinase (ribokinase family)
LTFDRIYDHFFREEEKNGINPDDIVVVDANVVDDEGNLLKLLQYLNEKGYFVIYECKGTKAIKVATDGVYRYMSLLKMNDRERDLVIRTLIETGVQVDSNNQYSWFSQNVGSLKKNHSYTSVNTIITNGEEKIRIISSNGEVKELTPVKSNCLVKTTGAGDTLTGAICALLLRGYTLEDALKLGTIASKMTVESESKISPVSLVLSLETLSKEYEKYRAHLVV